MKPHRRINRISVSSLSKHRPHTRLNVTLWAVFILAAIFLPLWAGSEGQRLLAEYQASPDCASKAFTPLAQNCRMMIIIRVGGKSIAESMGDRSRLADIMRFKAIMPDGEVRMLNVNFKQDGSSNLDNGEFDSFSGSRFLLLEAGKSVQAEYWQGRVTRITVLLPNLFMQNFTETTFRTTDHPAYYPAVMPSKVLSILGILLFPLILWTAYDLLSR